MFFGPFLGNIFFSASSGAVAPFLPRCNFFVGPEVLLVWVSLEFLTSITPSFVVSTSSLAVGLKMRGVFRGSWFTQRGDMLCEKYQTRFVVWLMFIDSLEDLETFSVSKQNSSADFCATSQSQYDTEISFWVASWHSLWSWYKMRPSLSFKLLRILFAVSTFVIKERGYFAIIKRFCWYTNHIHIQVDGKQKTPPFRRLPGLKVIRWHELCFQIASRHRCATNAWAWSFSPFSFANRSTLYATYCVLHMRVSRSNGKVPESAAADTRHQKKSEKKRREDGVSLSKI